MHKQFFENNPFYLAPMAELSHRALRELIEEFGGCDAYFTEMISANALFSGGPYEKWYIDTLPNPEKCVFQLVGADSEALAKAAGYLDNLECAGIDINMGCSAPLIRKTGAGAAWMASIDRAGELISRVRPQVKRRLSVKLRIGFKDDFEYLVRFCRRLENEGVELITLHPRLVSEKFKRLARWEYIGRLKNELKIPVVGNGDISSAQELVRRAAGNCDAVMVGRAAVKMPWIFAQAKDVEKEDFTANETFGSSTNQQELEPAVLSRTGEGTNSNTCLPSPQAEAEHDLQKQFLEFSAVETLKGAQKRVPPNVFAGRAPPVLEEIGIRFIELLSVHQPPDFHISRAKRFFGFFCDNLKWGTHLKNQINREESLSGIEKVWKEHFSVYSA
ncbi:MAG: tRNA-dihydrouridine synthase family protein [Treponema sp.]|nr:tRNA-dihydrouridine synthase family protein [Treponema sp.]